MSTVHAERDGAVLTITLDRPGRLNALTAETRAELLDALRSAGDFAVRAVVLAGAGRAFCVGQDLAADDELVDAAATVRDTYNPLVHAIHGLDRPVVAAVHGPAVGAGMGLALACDLRVMAESAYFACSFGTVGLVPDTGVSGELVGRLGHARAFDLAVTGRRMPAAEAQRNGLVNEVVADDAVAATAAQWARRLAEGPALALALTKRLFTAAAHLPPAELLEREALSQGVAAASAEHREGVAAFREKRPPQHGTGPVEVPTVVPRDAV